MSDGADVRSIDAVRDWYAALASYGEGLAEAMAGVELEIRRAHDWVGEQLDRWRRAVRACEEDVTRAKAELAQRKYAGFDGREPDCTVQEKNLRLARARLEHAEDQVEKCRQWLARLPKMVDEVYSGPSRRLVNFLEGDLPKGLAELGRRLAALESYAGLRPDYAPAPNTSGVVATGGPEANTPETPKPPQATQGEPAPSANPDPKPPEGRS